MAVELAFYLNKIPNMLKFDTRVSISDIELSEKSIEKSPRQENSAYLFFFFQSLTNASQEC